MISNKTINGIINYAEILESINIDLIRIISLDCINNMNTLKKLYLDISSKMSMIILTYSPRNSSSYKDLLLCEKKEGIYKYYDDFDFLEKSINSLFNKYKKDLYHLKRVRNKIEHDIDIIGIDEMHSGSGVCGVIFSIDDEKYKINTDKLKKIISDLNLIFSKMLEDIDLYIKNNDSKNYNHPYYNQLRSFNFLRYNNIFNSTLLYSISEILNNIIKKSID